MKREMRQTPPELSGAIDDKLLDLVSEDSGPASGSAMLDFLIEETSEDAVCCMLTAISVFGIDNKEDALFIIDKDPDCAKWLEYTVSHIVGPWEQNAKDQTAP